MIVGIDLGTTNSAVAIWRDGQALLIPNSLGHVLTPSVVSIDETGDVLVGLAARERLVTHPTQTAAAFKRYMGTRREAVLGKKSYFAEDLSALVLKQLKSDAEAFLGEPVTEAVITVPAYFNDTQRKATRMAGQLAGLKVERLLNEPTAAALAYGINLKDEAKFLVFDLGGGTFDVSILELFEGVIEVRATTGDNRLGGEDFNNVLARMMVDRFKNDFGAKNLETPALIGRIRAAAELARRALSVDNSGTMTVVWKNKEYSLQVGVDEFEEAAGVLLARLREPVAHALRDGSVRAEDLDEIILVGGATRMPVVRRAVTKMFGRFPSAAVNPDEAVAVGAAVQAGLKARDAALGEVVLTDVCPYSLGVNVSERLANGDVRDGIFSPVIERNTVIPASREKSFHTMYPNQRSVKFQIYQGESRKVSDNVRLGEIDVPVPPAQSGGSVGVACRFSYDINGLLEVDLFVSESGERRELVILNDHTISPEELARRREALAELKQHPRDSAAARALMARAARCYEQTLGERREQVARLILQFENVLERQDPKAIDRAQEEVSAYLDAIEGETWL
ncbi:MAG TPA: molecular chaperone HscC [Caulobacteraceae bacterium]|nr:molecular chaperone HscC [Caulobacteraceae bacterium]